VSAAYHKRWNCKLSILMSMNSDYSEAAPE
jgi:hypothetical protein